MKNPSLQLWLIRDPPEAVERRNVRRDVNETGPSSASLSKGENKETEAEGRGNRGSPLSFCIPLSCFFLHQYASSLPPRVSSHSVSFSTRQAYRNFFLREHREDARCCGRWFGRDVFGQKGGREPGLGDQHCNAHHTQNNLWVFQRRDKDMIDSF